MTKLAQDGPPLARRGLMMTGLITGLTLATTRVEAQVIHTDTAGLEAGEARVPVVDGELPAYFARPQGNGPFPIVLVNAEIFGVHEHIKDICRRLAKAGYLAVAPEVYARLADLSKMTDAAVIMRDVISKAPDATLMADLDATLRWATAHGGDSGRVGVTGFCRGGRATWLYAAHNPTLKAAVAWYGQVGGARTEIQPKTVTDIADRISCPLLALYGGKDTSIPVADVQAAVARARAAGRTVDLVIYPDSGHAFLADYRPSYRATDAADGWQRMLAWFRGHGVG
ncbi:putative carboxymethylenebutenolidase [Rhodovastum atsumiense]|uniref:Dienelactone hydrolase family protein n=1 Tax=Rhodovastum atsumiense TaxID=504468 RepID=A0A5M6IK16_9PROT|nr:dienelactone hydrolase family protein [Rhodovastum atsumiense]KAA5608035.1 dienelactone hydrolase family protein [Rhodovastum atsumiense]CAH2604978.1 putative carboxymethylenebutenolidase [Rhodovastum atsumiense]